MLAVMVMFFVQDAHGGGKSFDSVVLLHAD
jgi:hypothetical protein